MPPRKASLFQRRLGVCNISFTASQVSPRGWPITSAKSLLSDASDFLRKHPWPGRAISETFDDSNHRHGSFSKRFLGALKVICGRTGDTEDVYDEVDYEEEQVLYDATEEADIQRPFYWSQSLQQSFRDELEKFVILRAS